MPDGSVALRDTEIADLAARLVGALARADGVSASAATESAPDGWFLFDTPRGGGAFKPLTLGGLAVSAPNEQDGAAAAALIERCETTLSVIERTIGVAIEPSAIGPQPDGITALIEGSVTAAAEGDGSGEAIILLTVPAETAQGLPPTGAADGAIVHRVRLPAPALGVAEIPGAGDMLVLGHAVPCELNPARPIGTAAYAGTITAGGDGGVPTAPTVAGAEVSFETALTKEQSGAIKGGAPLVIAEGMVPSAIYNTGDSARAGQIVPLGGVVYFRFD